MFYEDTVLNYFQKMVCRLTRFTRKTILRILSLCWICFLTCTICMAFWMLVGAECSISDGETVDPFGWIVMGLVGGLMASLSVQRP